MLRPKRSLVRAIARSDVPLVRRDVGRPLALPPLHRRRAARVAMALSELSGDEQGILFVQLCNVLDPGVAVALQLAYLPRGLGLCKAAEGAARQRHAAQCVRRKGLVRG